MKKNKMMRLASAMMVLTLMSTSVISGTFAKYVTSDDAQDTARVAKFGVVVTADGALFADTYKDAPETDDVKITVDSDNGDKVVAPGTNNAAETLKFSITGTPEVDVKVDVVVTTEKGDVFLKAADGLPKMTTGDENDTFNLDADYYPVKYTLKKQGTAVVTDVKLSELVTALTAISVTKVEANEDLGTLFGEYEITWKWEIDGNDEADTLLGDLAADTTLKPAKTLTPGADYNLNTGLKIEVTVTQID